MSSALRCDRCKRFYDQNDENDRLNRKDYKGIRIYGMTIIDGYQDTLKYFDLCSHCVKDLYNFIVNEDTERAE